MPGSKHIAAPTLLLGLLLGPGAMADYAGVANEARARTNYMLNCQGCHGPNGAGSRDGAVPRMQNYVGNFLKVPGGREFVVQVPGSANAALSDERLAELLNWMLATLSAEQLPADFVPFEAAEVKRLRRVPETDVVGVRAALVEKIQIVLASQ